MSTEDDELLEAALHVGTVLEKLWTRRGIA
jgi:hypothetical protein